KELVAPIVLPEGKTVLDVFRVCFDDNASLLEEYHTARKDTNQKWEPWRLAKTGSPRFSGQRLFTCTTIIRALVSKACPFTEYQRYAFMNIGGKEPTLVVQLSGQAEGVMFADAFRAETLLIFTQLGASVTMRALGHVQFLRDVWIKGKILRTSLNTEMPECYRKLGYMLIERLQGDTLDSLGVTERFEASPPLQASTVEPRKDSSHVSIVVWKPAIYVEFVLEVLSVLLCINSFLHTYFFTASTPAIGIKRPAAAVSKVCLVLSDVEQSLNTEVLSSLFIDLLRPFFLASLVCLLCVIHGFICRTLAHMR
ncbi:hypothetical protein TraAM80_07746, partial [Trypanosoma rangeli]